MPLPIACAASEVHSSHSYKILLNLMQNLLKRTFALHRDNVPTTSSWGSNHVAHVAQVAQHVITRLRLISLKEISRREVFFSVPVQTCVSTTATPAGKMSPSAVSGFLQIRANLSCRLLQGGLVPFIFL